MLIIPRGKEVKIAMNGKNVLSDFKDVKLTLSSELTISLQSHFNTLLGDQSGTASTVLKLIGGASESFFGFGFSGQFKEQGYQIWQNTDPIKFSCEVMLNMKTDARLDVFLPSRLLMKMPLPRNASSDEDSNGIGLIAPGPTLPEALGVKTKKGVQHSFRCGVYYLPSIIVEAVEPTFSSETDSNGYPIWCQLKIDVSSIFTATQDQMDLFGYNNYVDKDKKSATYGQNLEKGTLY